MNVDILQSDSDHIVGVFGPVLISRWRHETTVPAVMQLQSNIRKFTHGRTSRIALVTVVEPNAVMPGSKAKSAMSDIYHKYRSTFACNAIVIEGEGFRAASVRAIVTTLQRVTSNPFPVRCFPTVAEGDSWVRGELERSRSSPLPRIGEIAHASAQLSRSHDDLMGSEQRRNLGGAITKPWRRFDLSRRMREEGVPQPVAYRIYST